MDRHEGRRLFSDVDARGCEGESEGESESESESDEGEVR